jgi:hypothetical protein
MSTPETKAPRGSILSEIDLPLFASMSLHTVLVYVAVVMARFTASYAMLDLGLSFFWVPRLPQHRLQVRNMPIPVLCVLS